MGTTSDRNDPRLGYGTDDEPTEQNEVYLVLSDEERAKGFVRPVRKTYIHMYMLDGSRVPYPLTSWAGVGGCGAATTMNTAIAETYARDPKFYGATYCVGCRRHISVSEFVWEDHQQVGS